MRVVAVVQARMGSSRLPGKVLLDLGGEPMLARVVSRMLRAASLDGLVVATTTAAADDAIVRLCAARGWPWFRGSEGDVLDRTYRAALRERAGVVVRVTSDCPLVDPELVDRVVADLGAGSFDYVSNTLPPRSFPRGLDVEAIRLETLARAWREDGNPAWREHVTPYVYRNPEGFSLGALENDENLSHLRWTVDAPEDLAFAQAVYGHFGHDGFGWRDVRDALRGHPDWSRINGHVAQREAP